MNDHEGRIILGLRALAVLLIIVDHFFFMSNIYTHETFPYTFFRDGMNGIFLIFICESYAVARQVIKGRESQKDFSVWKYYLRRLFVVVPCLYLYLFVVKNTELFNSKISDESFLSALTFTFNYLGKPHQDIVMHFWAFCAEETIIFFLLPIIVFFRRNTAILILLFFALASICARAYTYYFLIDPQSFDWWVYMQTHLHVFGPAFGFILALTKGSSKLNVFFERLRLHWIAILVLVLLSPYLEPILKTPYLWLYKPIVSCLCFAIVMKWLLEIQGSYIANILTSSPFHSIGKIYFSLYIWQQPFTFVYFATNKTIEGIMLSLIGAFLFGVSAYFLVERFLYKFSLKVIR